MKEYSILYIYCIFILPIYGLHKALKYYETIHSRHFEYEIVKHDIYHSYYPCNKISELKFYSHGRHFQLILQLKREVMHSKLEMYEVDADRKEKIIPLDYDFYHGQVFGEIDSYAQLHIDDGIVTGSITLADETFYIEPSWRHLPHLDNQTMIIYKSSDVKVGKQYQNTEDHIHGLQKTCGYVNENLENSKQSKFKMDSSLSIIKRDYKIYEYPPTKTRCPLLLVADYRFYNEMGGGSAKTTTNYLISLLDRVHKIYSDTLWQAHQEQDGFKGMGFVIKKIIVHSEPTRVRDDEMHYNMVRDEWDGSKLLQMFTREYSYKNFCLTYLFTALKLKINNNPIVGLAYLSFPHKNSGGICALEDNSGLISAMNYHGRRMIIRKADLTTAHEFGHNWGSEHDPLDITECSPSASRGGAYLMHRSSAEGYVNNNKFSPCSVRSISKNLQAKSWQCFLEPEESFPGNLRVERDEECDVGIEEDSDYCYDNNCKL